MSFRFHLLPVVAVGCLALLTPARALDIQFDYTYDTGSFFVGHADRQSLLEAAAAVFESHLADTLAAITPSGSNTWTAYFDNPSTGVEVGLVDLTIQTGVIRVYVGAQQLGTSTLGMGGPGSFDSFGSPDWNNNLTSRGQAGALLATPTDVGPWGGSITFDFDTDWYFGVGSPAGKNDFLSVATHELGHLLGIGTADSWTALISGSKFTGANATAANGGIQVSLSGSGHWANGTMSTVFGTSTIQEAAMDPSITVGTQKCFTTLDFAGLQDIGWTVVPEPSTITQLTGATALIAAIRRRRRRTYDKNVR